jgi:hypothetical protein
MKSLNEKGSSSAEINGFNILQIFAQWAGNNQEILLKT